MNGQALRRVGALFVFVSLLGSIMVIGAPGALAHHPEISASTRCDGYGPVIDYVATSWASGSKGENANIGIYVDGVWADSGSFSKDSGYTFSGTIDASSWVGKTVTVTAQADGSWGNGMNPGDSRSTTVAIEADACGNTTTTEEPTTTTTIPGTYVSGNPKCVDLGYAQGVKSDSPGTDVTIDGVFFDYNGLSSVSVSSSDLAIQAVIVKGGNGAQVYTSSFANLVAPLNNGGQQADISHVEACIDPYETTTTTEQETTTTTDEETTTTTAAPEEAFVWVNVGRCEEQSGVSLTPVWVRVEPAGSATVTLRGPDGSIEFTETGSVTLEPGRYFWSTKVVDGFELTGQGEGSFRTANCTSNDTMVHVKIGECTYDPYTGVVQKDVEFRIAPGGTATITVEGPGGPYEIDGSGERLNLAPGTYRWTASPIDGYAMVGVAQGKFIVEDCSPQCTALIGDVVWFDDAPRNGLQDEGEELIEGVAVQLLDGEGAVLATTVTDENGHYEFADLCEGTYRVRFELPDLPGVVNEAWTTQGGGDPSLDSNADANGLTDLIEVTNRTEDLTWDAGIVANRVSPTTTPSTTTTEPTTTTTVEITTTTVENTTTTVVDPTTSSSVAPVVTSTTVPPVTASTLPFTGFEVQTTALLGLLALVGGGVLLMAVGGRREEQEDSDSIGAW